MAAERTLDAMAEIMAKQACATMLELARGAAG